MQQACLWDMTMAGSGGVHVSEVTVISTGVIREAFPEVKTLGLDLEI